MKVEIMFDTVDKHRCILHVSFAVGSITKELLSFLYIANMFDK